MHLFGLGVALIVGDFDLFSRVICATVSDDLKPKTSVAAAHARQARITLTLMTNRKYSMPPAKPPFFSCFGALGALCAGAFSARGGFGAGAVFIFFVFSSSGLPKSASKSLFLSAIDISFAVVT